MAEVAIVGVGAIGGVLAGLLQSTGQHRLTLCTRRVLSRLPVQTPEGLVEVEAHNITDPAQASTVDWVLVATKTYDAPGAKRWLNHLCARQGGELRTRIAVVQNGVEHREHFAPEWPVLPVVIDVGAERCVDGSVLQRTAATMRAEDSADGHSFATLFAGAPARMELTSDFVTAAWSKLCVNVAGVVSALTLRPAGVLRDQAPGRLAVELVKECILVGRAEGAKLDDALGERILADYRAGSPDSVNSLLADRLAGRQTEIGARNGVVVRGGERHGIPTPLNRMAVTLMEASRAV